MVPNKFNMIDLDGLDIIESQGVIVAGLYDKLVESIALCRYQCIYNWKFNSIPIPPTYVELDIKADGVWINDGIVVSQDNTIHIYTLEPNPPVINPLNVVSNGVYNVSEGVDGFNPVSVQVPPPVIEPIKITENGTYTPQDGLYGFSLVEVEVPVSESCVYTKRSTKPIIDTGVPCNTEGLRVILRCTIPSIIQETGIFGGTWSFNGFLLILYGNTLRFHSKSQPSLDVPQSDVNIGLFSENVVECTKDYITVNGTTYQMTGTGSNTDENLKLFSVGGYNAAEIGVYSLDIYRGEELIRSFTPAYNENEACLYDSITEQYFYNIGANEIYYN